MQLDKRRQALWNRNQGRTWVIWNELQFFERREFLCPCCESEGMDSDFLRKLDDIRRRLNFPLPVTSGYRCPDYNDKISTTGRNGPHTTGKAADLSLMGRQAFQFVQQASLGGWFTGIGLRQHGAHTKRFIHVDDLPSGDGRFRPTVWTYNVDL
jgi:hypothetical protein